MEDNREKIMNKEYISIWEEIVAGEYRLVNPDPDEEYMGRIGLAFSPGLRLEDYVVVREIMLGRESFPILMGKT